MVIEMGEVRVNPEPLVLRIFLKSIELLGGLKKLAEFRTLTWLPSLARAAYAVVLREEYNRIEDDIANEIGLTRQTVRNILRADPDMAMEKVRQMQELVEEEGKEMKVHTAGGIAKLAYKLIKEGQDVSSIFLEYSTQVMEHFTEEVPWAYKILKIIREREIKFPIESQDDLIKKFHDIRIKDTPIEDIAPKMTFPINNPAILLKKIKEAMAE